MLGLRRLFLPHHCAVCLSVGSPLCDGCAHLLVPPPVWDEVSPDLSFVSALFGYEGAGRALIHRLKYANHRDALRVLSRGLAETVVPACDVVTWVPTTPERRRERGYDQAELIGRSVASELGIPAFATVRRVGAGTQVGLDRRHRLDVAFESLQGVERARSSPRSLGGRRVLVVDDVRTTGSSILGVARELRRSGAGDVAAATLAATRRGVRRSSPHVGSRPLQSR